ASSPPALSPRIQQVYFLPTKSQAVAALEVEAELGQPSMDLEKSLVYRPVLFASGRVHFVNRRRGVEDREEYALINPISEQLGSILWEKAIQLSEADPSRLYSSEPQDGAIFEDLPESINESSEISSIKEELEDYLYRARSISLFFSPVLKVYSALDESERDFRTRLRQIAREARDDEVDKLNQRFDSRLRKLQDRLRKAELTLDKKEATSQARSREFLVSVGESLVGIFLGRRSMRSASSSLGKYRMKSSAEMAIKEVEERVEGLKRDAEALAEELQDQTTTITERWDEAVENVESVPIAPRRSDVEVDIIAIAWEPYWLIGYSDKSGASRTQSILAHSR
ncbi:MAG: hypothetical protein ACWGQW_22975, partial [bacterium]